MANKVPHSIKLSRKTDEVIESMRTTRKPEVSFNYMVEYLMENNPEFIAHKSQMEALKKSKKK